MATERTCSECGAPVPENAPGNRCPKCLLGFALEETRDASGKTRVLSASDILSEEIGTVIGRYKLLQQIGEGGFGVVFMAEQTEPVQRKVALKIIKAGMDTREVIARFEAERQALALMDHPNIAQVLDGGTTATGRPYFVMELVRGMPITDYCDQAGLSTRERLELFIKVCRAVQHAHQKGVIHRDIKSSNVLVTLHDGEPVPKVIDFGVAKALGQRLTDKTLFTRFEQMIGTPAYMSPEQAALSGLDIDTRSDIYSLGVLLYELLSGETPLDRETLRRGALDEIRRMIREADPPKPSTRLSNLVAADIRRLTNSESEEDRASLRRLLQQKNELITAIRGDLDWITMKALEKDRRCRYETVNGLAADIERYLNHEPVLARPPSAFYRFQRAVRRHRMVFAAAGAIAAALVLGVVISTWQAVRATREKLAARLNLYVGDMNLAQQSLAAGDLGRAMQLVERHRPKAGEPDLRGFEWRYLWRLCRGDEHFALPEHSNLVWSGEFSPKGDVFVTCDSSKHIRVWDAASRLLLTEFNGSARSTSFLPGGKTLVAASSRAVRLLDTTDWREQGPPGNWEEELRDCHAPVAVSNDGKLLAAMSDTGVRVFDTGTWQLIRHLTNASGPLAFSASGPILATDSPDGIALWPLGSLEPPRLLEESRDLFAPINNWLTGAKCIAFSPNGAWLVAADNARSFGVAVWEVASGRKAEPLPTQHAGEVAALAFSPDGQILATGSWDHSIRLWDFPARRCLATLQGHLHEVWMLSFSPDGATLLSGSKDGGAKLWDVTARIREKVFPGNAQPIRFSRDGQTLATVSTNWVVQFHDLKNGTTFDAFTFPSNAVPSRSYVWWGRTYSISPDLDLLALRIGESKVQLWSVAAARQVAEWSEGTNHILKVLFSPDGKTIAMSTARNRHRAQDFGPVKLWEFATGRVQSFAPEKPEVIDPVAFSPDGRYIATTHDGGKTIVWDVPTLRKGAVLQWPNSRDYVLSAAFSSDSRLLATVSFNNMAALWEVSSGRFLGAFAGHKQAVASVAFSPDGRTLASGGNDGTIRFWEIKTRQEVLSFVRPGLHLIDLSFSSDGQVFASGSASFSGVVPQFPVLRAASWAEADRRAVSSH